MDGRAMNDRTLGRIAATLVALAVLAERASGRSFPIRWLVLCLLCRAEAVAHDFVAATTGLALRDPEEGWETGNSPAAAACLALRLRMLAALLAAVSPPDGGPDPSDAGAGTALRRFATRHARLSAMAGGVPCPTPDTS